MKKAVIALSLAAVMVFSGCVKAGPAGTGPADTYISAGEMAESLAARMRETIDTHSLAGFTRETTFGEAVEKTGAQRVELACLVNNADFLGYPAVMVCFLKNNENGGLSVWGLSYDILISGERSNESDIEDILAKLDAELGSHTMYSDDVHKYTDYFWNKDGVRIEMSIAETSTEAGTLASVSVDTPGGAVLNTPAKTPGIFRYSLGADYSTIYQNEIPAKTPGRFTTSYICFQDNECSVRLTFTAESGELKLYSGSYAFCADDTGETDGTEYLVSIQESMKSILGAPKYEHLGEPEFSGSDYSLELYMYWPGINIHAGYGKGARIDVDFNEEFITAGCSSALPKNPEDQN